MTRNRSEKAEVFLYEDGHLAFVAVDAEGKPVAGMGANQEIQDLNLLVELSKDWIEWDLQPSLLSDLARQQRECFSPETQSIMYRVF